MIHKRGLVVVPLTLEASGSSYLKCDLPRLHQEIVVSYHSDDDDVG